MKCKGIRAFPYAASRFGSRVPPFRYRSILPFGRYAPSLQNAYGAATPANASAFKSKTPYQ